MPETAEYEFRTGSGRLCLDYIRTLRWRGTDEALEELATPEALAAWIGRLGPCDADVEIPTPTPRTLRTAQETREAVYSLLKAARATAPKDCPPDARDLLNKAASASSPRATSPLVSGRSASMSATPSSAQA